MKSSPVFFQIFILLVLANNILLYRRVENIIHCNLRLQDTKKSFHFIVTAVIISPALPTLRFFLLSSKYIIFQYCL